MCLCWAAVWANGSGRGPCRGTGRGVVAPAPIRPASESLRFSHRRFVKTRASDGGAWPTTMALPFLLYRPPPPRVQPPPPQGRGSSFGDNPPRARGGGGGWGGLDRGGGFRGNIPICLWGAATAAGTKGAILLYIDQAHFLTSPPSSHIRRAQTIFPHVTHPLAASPPGGTACARHQRPLLSLRIVWPCPSGLCGPWPTGDVPHTSPPGDKARGPAGPCSSLASAVPRDSPAVGQSPPPQNAVGHCAGPPRELVIAKRGRPAEAKQTMFSG